MGMIEIGNAVVSLEILTNHFVCHLEKCQGACCVFGDSGAPVGDDEKLILDQVLDRVVPYMTPEGIEAVREKGTSVIDREGDRCTPLLGPEEECAYAFFEDGIARCAIEKAFLNGEISFQKPISCHLYPIRISRYASFDAVNYHLWHICAPACQLGDQEKVPLYRFLKEPLIRKYGTDWYEQLETAALMMKEQNLL